jgi:hypothetical protein
MGEDIAAITVDVEAVLRGLPERPDGTQTEADTPPGAYAARLLTTTSPSQSRIQHHPQGRGRH